MEVVHDGQAEEVATNGKQRWPLSPSTTLRLTMNQASTEASSDKVSGPWEPGATQASSQAGPEQAGRWKQNTGHICHFQFSNHHLKRAKRNRWPSILSFQHASNIKNSDESAYFLFLHQV